MKWIIHTIIALKVFFAFNIWMFIIQKPVKFYLYGFLLLNFKCTFLNAPKSKLHETNVEHTKLLTQRKKRFNMRFKQCH